MNRLKGQIEEIKVNGNLSQVSILIGKDTLFKSIIIETPETVSYLVKDHQVDVIFKETEVVLAKGKTDNISLINRIDGEIKELKKGKMLCEVILATEAGIVTAIVSRDAFDILDLKTGETLTAMVKLNEVMIAE